MGGSIIYTKTGLQVRPYRGVRLNPLVNSRSIWDPVRHRYIPVTAYPMKHEDEKLLATYYVDKTYIHGLIPDYTIEEMEPNMVLPIESDFQLNEDVIPSEIQASAIKLIIDKGFHQAFFNIPTGVGKTLMAIYLSSILRVKSLIMCYNVNVLDQWYATIDTMTTFDTRRCVLLTRSKDLLAVYEGSYPVEMYDIYMCTPGLLTKFVEKNGFDLLNEIVNLMGIGVKYFDEAHRNIANITKINALTNIDRTYYLSADFSQADSRRRELYYKMFQSVPIVKPNGDVLEELKHIIAVVVHYNTEPTLLEQESAYSRYGFNHHSYMEYQIGSKEFFRVLELVLKSIDETNKSHHKVLILANMIEHVDYIAFKIEKMVKDCGLTVGRFHSQIDKKIKKNVLDESDIIVSTYQSMGVGVDVQGIRYVVSLAQVNPIEDNQAAGRARALPTGEDCYYFMLCDDGFEYSKKKLPSRLAYLEQQKKIKKVFSIHY